MTRWDYDYGGHGCGSGTSYSFTILKDSKIFTSGTTQFPCTTTIIDYLISLYPYDPATDTVYNMGVLYYEPPCSQLTTMLTI